MVSEEELQAIRDAARWLPKRGGSHDIKLLLEHIDGLESEIALCNERIYLQDGELLSLRMEADRYAAEAEAAYRQRDQAQSASDPDLDAIRARLTNANSLALDESVARWYRTDIPVLLEALIEARLKATWWQGMFDRCLKSENEAQAALAVTESRVASIEAERDEARESADRWQDRCLDAQRERDALRDGGTVTSHWRNRIATLEATLAEVRALRTRDRERLAKVEALADEWTKEGDDLIRNCHSGRDVNEGYQMWECATALRAALATTSEEAER